MENVTQILSDMRQGDPQAANELLPIVYDELRRLAAHRLSNEASGQTLQATALVHEAYIRLVGEEDPEWNNRGHFFGAAAEAMRRILVDIARNKKSVRRGGARQRIDLKDSAFMVEEISDDLVALDEALHGLEQRDKQAAQLVKLRYFGGLTMPQAAKALEIPLRTAEREWAYAKAWLYGELSKGRTPVVK